MNWVERYRIAGQKIDLLNDDRKPDQIPSTVRNFRQSSFFEIE